jgi:hypothetical protein
MKRLLAALVLTLLVAPAYAHDYEIGLTAFELGDYVTALDAWRTATEMADARTRIISEACTMRASAFLATPARRFGGTAGPAIKDSCGAAKFCAHVSARSGCAAGLYRSGSLTSHGHRVRVCFRTNQSQLDVSKRSRYRTGRLCRRQMVLEGRYAERPLGPEQSWCFVCHRTRCSP